MRTLIILLFLALPAFPQMLSGIVGGKPPAVATCSVGASNTAAMNAEYAIGNVENNYYAGQRFDASMPVSGSICKVTFYLTATGTITGKTLVARVWSLTGGNLNAQLGASTGVTGSNSWSETAVEFTFASPVTVTLNGSYSITLDVGGTDASNYASLAYVGSTVWTGYTTTNDSGGVVRNYTANTARMVIYVQ